MRFLPRFAVCLAAMFVLATSSVLQAGEITGVSWFSGVASVASTMFFPPAVPNNDDVAGNSPNGVFVTQKNYVGIGPVDLVFDVADTGGTTEYLFVEGVQNTTGIDWSGYHVELGYGIGGAFTKVSGDGLDFDSPDFNSLVNFNPAPGFFPSLAVTEDDIIATGGIHPTFTFAGFHRFHIDIPDGITQFTLRQSPIPLEAEVSGIIPEPSSMLLLGLGAIGLMRRARRNRLEKA
jgi:hypothetical protein